MTLLRNRTPAEVAELADALDSKSSALKACRFESGLRHQLKSKTTVKFSSQSFFVIVAGIEDYN